MNNGGLSLDKLSYLEFINIAKINNDVNTQIMSFKHNPVRTLDYIFKDRLKSCVKVSKLQSSDNDLQAWIVTYKENRPRYIVMAQVPDWKITVTDETSLDINDPDSILKEI